jgi:predicted RNase H-like HicB family nuclease
MVRLKKELILLERGKPVIPKNFIKVIEAIEEDKTNLLYMMYEIFQLLGKRTKEESISFLFENVFKDMKIEIIKPVIAPKELKKIPVTIRRISNYDVLIFEEEDGFTVTCPSLPGCITEGDTEEEAIRNVREAIKAYLECARKYGVKIKQ